MSSPGPHGVLYGTAQLSENTSQGARWGWNGIPGDRVLELGSEGEWQFLGKAKGQHVPRAGVMVSVASTGTERRPKESRVENHLEGSRRGGDGPGRAGPAAPVGTLVSPKNVGGCYGL